MCYNIIHAERIYVRGKFSQPLFIASIKMRRKRETEIKVGQIWWCEGIGQRVLEIVGDIAVMLHLQDGRIRHNKITSIFKRCRLYKDIK